MHRPHHHCNKIPAIEFDDTDTHRIYLMLDGGQLPELELQLFEVSESPAYQPLISTLLGIVCGRSHPVWLRPTSGVVTQISCMSAASPAPGDRYTRGCLTGIKLFSLFIVPTYAIISPTLPLYFRRLIFPASNCLNRYIAVSASERRWYPDIFLQCARLCS